MSAIILKDLVYEVDGKRILDQIHLEVPRGEILSIMGQSGSGKTTLLRIMTGLRRATSGQVLIDGEDITKMPERELDRVRLKMGLVFQYAALFDSLTVYDNIVFGVVRHKKRISREDLDALVKELLEAVGLEESVKNLYPAQLSGGMQKRVGLARALAMRPSFLFYDEPTSGLDPITAHTIDQLIVQTCKRRGVTSVVVSHHLPSIFTISDRIAMLHEGRIVAIGTPNEIRHSDNPVVQAFIAPEKDLLLSAQGLS
ncbi:ABC-type transport system involved in resistance to organic solvents, ATPase component [Chthonomonas calidirosea]|uniref:ABC-type transport system involved in resistance to organic solvents, ATPase component n=1 Tax=Chthonomonas calidirosea (strain DSM 23976 / ICMP 18418 / T49) TaxID=1303518 RepID=S0EXW4_CHTCT|nr:ATP-binding cassette domain-containing protein [Chthonomonas calidirosea]CCW35141.1 ABC-type transport system involved in resistance to organic solvents, ATPase component [Chthonomonas calidirosea T49]CEK20185.1 ABC-type transport system involved in resistance to organic solvents, ATPase component [Chthonomonas calidirosea]CEK20843.1 ABC-type transport system involved in resistance to organic solvents, ATPase component [Chthonomonas calidirosea]